MDDARHPDDAGGAPQTEELDLPLGPPFALSHDCELIPRNDARGVVGCCACISCDDCGQQFRVDLLAGSYSQCPKCRMEYTHVLIVCTRDDPTMLGDAARVIARSNGLVAENPDDDEDEDEDDEGEGGDLGAVEESEGDDDDGNDDTGAPA